MNSQRFILICACSISIDGHNIKTLDHDWLHSRIALVCALTPCELMCMHGDLAISSYSDLKHNHPCYHERNVMRKTMAPLATARPHYRNNRQVSQEPVLFACSIRENIVYGARDPTLVTMEEIEAAAKQVCIVAAATAIMEEAGEVLRDSIRHRCNHH